MVGEAGDADVVVGVQTQALAKALRSVLLAVVFELLGDGTEVGFVDGGDGFLPQGLAVGAHLEFFQFTFGDGLDHHVGKGAELGVVREGVAVHLAGRHHLVGHHAVVAEAVNDIVEGTTLTETHVAVGTHCGIGAVVVGLLNHVHLAQVILALAHAEQLALEEGDARVAPAGTGVVLVLDGGDGQHLDGVELVALVLFFLILCHHSTGANSHSAKE